MGVTEQCIGCDVTERNIVQYGVVYLELKTLRRLA